MVDEVIFWNLFTISFEDQAKCDRPPKSSEEMVPVAAVIEVIALLPTKKKL